MVLRSKGKMKKICLSCTVGRGVIREIARKTASEKLVKVMIHKLGKASCVFSTHTSTSLFKTICHDYSLSTFLFILGLDPSWRLVGKSKRMAKKYCSSICNDRLHGYQPFQHQCI